MNKRTRKLITMHKALHPRDDVNRLYESRKKEARVLANIEDSVDTSIQRLENFMKNCGGRLITVARNNSDDTRITVTEIARKQKWEEKQIYGRFKRITSDNSLSLRVLGLLISSLLLFAQRFGWYVLLWNLHGTSNYVLYWIHGCTCVKHSCIATRLQSGLNQKPPDDCLLRSLRNQRYVSCWTIQNKFLELTWIGLLLLFMIFFTSAHIRIFFTLAFLIISSDIVFNSILGLLSRSL